MDVGRDEPLRLPTISALLGTALLAVGMLLVLTWLLVVAAPWAAAERDPSALADVRIDLVPGSLVGLSLLAVTVAAAVMLLPVDHRTRRVQRRGAVVALLLSAGGAVMGAAGLLGSYRLVFAELYAGVLLVSLVMLVAALAIGYEAPQRRTAASAP